MRIPGDLRKKLLVGLILVLLIFLIKLFSTNSFWVENYYVKGFYYNLSTFMRYLFGWLPFSGGDLLYLIVAVWLVIKVAKAVRLIFKRGLTKKIFFSSIWKMFVALGIIYIVFNIFWGLNYNRKGIGWQLHLNEVAYDTANLELIQELLLQKVNDAKRILVKNTTLYPVKEELFKRATQCYVAAEGQYSFLHYKSSSIKSSLYGELGNYLGFTGYYNPFTGEAQVNTTVPKFLLPYVTLHEMGHQLGYAKENEANFSGYLAGANSADTLFQYSTYLDLFIYANREVYYFDSALSKAAAKKLIPEVKADLLEWSRFNAAHTSFIEPAITWLYGKYLQINQQPKGMRSYNEVIAMLMSYYKKYGRI